MAKVLVVVSSAHVLKLKDGVDHPTGHFLGELAEPVKALQEAGHQLTFASPGGARPTIDQDSLRDIYWIADDDGRQEALQLVEHLRGFQQPEVLETLSEAELDQFDGLFVPGGHAPIVDLMHSAAMSRVLLHFHNEEKPIGLICHAPVVLLSTASVTPWPFAGYKLTVFGHMEEKIAETFFLGGDAPFYPNQALTAQGAEVSNALLPSMPHVVVDRELVTGQNPYSAKSFAAAFLDALQRPSADPLYARVAEPNPGLGIGFDGLQISPA